MNAPEPLVPAPRAPLYLFFHLAPLALLTSRAFTTSCWSLYAASQVVGVTRAKEPKASCCNWHPLLLESRPTNATTGATPTLETVHHHAPRVTGTRMTSYNRGRKMLRSAWRDAGKAHTAGYSKLRLAQWDAGTARTASYNRRRKMLQPVIEKVTTGIAESFNQRRRNWRPATAQPRKLQPVTKKVSTGDDGSYGRRQKAATGRDKSCNWQRKKLQPSWRADDGERCRHGSAERCMGARVAGWPASADD